MLTAIPEGDPPGPADGARSQWAVGGPDDLAPVRASISSLTKQSPATPVAPVLASVAERLAVVFSELATNALRHGAPPVSATAYRSIRGWVVIVSDAQGSAPPTLREPYPQGGHGLRLIKQLAHGVGWCRAGTAKQVWAEVGLEPPGDMMRRLTTNGSVSATP